jgi:tRNA (mo5U34)-methyltransferase
LVVRQPPSLTLERRDPELGIAFIEERIDRRLAATPDDRAGETSAPPADSINAPASALAVARLIESKPWYHTLELPHGIVTRGHYDHRPLVPVYGIPPDLEGKRVLDVGSADGFWAFEFERRGAAVTAIDIETTAGVDLPVAVRRLAAGRGYADPLGDGFALAHHLLGSSVQRVAGTVYDLDAARLGRFDLVHAGDLLLHLRDPVRALEQIRSVTGGQALLSDVYDSALETGLVRHLGGWQTAGWNIPSLGSLVQMVADAGFSRVRVVTTYRLAARGMATGPWRAVILGS